MHKIMSHKDWMKVTYGGRTARRSTKLKVIDTALLTHDRQPTPANKSAVSAALAAWMASKGAAWKTSVRNKSHAVENLQRQLSGQAGPARNTVALSHIRNESRAIVTNLFLGQKLVFRPGLTTKLTGNGTFARLGGRITVAGTARNAGTLVGEAAPSVSVPVGATPRPLAVTVLATVVPDDVYTDVMQAMASIMPSFMQELTASCMPFLGVGISGATTVANLAKLARSQYRLDMGSIHARRTLSTGDPDAAFQAVIRMLEREAENNLAGFGVGLAEFGSKAAAMLADGGTATNAAIGAASGMVKLLMLARLVVRDVQERNAANKLLTGPIITSDLFTACPVMGAYMICCAPTSVTVNTMLSSERFYEPDMMDIVERAVKRHIEPLKFQANRLVKEHRMYIPSLQNAPGIMAKNKKNLKAMAQPSTAEWADRINGFGSEDF